MQHQHADRDRAEGSDEVPKRGLQHVTVYDGPHIRGPVDAQEYGGGDYTPEQPTIATQNR